ncbi:hypothetical protein HF086_011594 [Spodoptera exigua]|uniref:Uncharacterized protein n=1 Tax=Spodoptera exigua TaxID=7107 RepID=A0A922MCV2_SPOEX|nr:hypothetical protein HF086_011594 [Spodoptera exigua]
MSEYCFICAKLLTESEVVTVERDMKTLINASIERVDDFSEYLKNQKFVTIHENCRKNYTRKSSIAATNKRQREEQDPVHQQQVLLVLDHVSVNQLFVSKNYAYFVARN